MDTGALFSSYRKVFSHRMKTAQAGGNNKMIGER